MIFKGTRETLRALLLFLATIQATAGVGVISVVTVLLRDSVSSVSLSEPHVLVPIVLHLIAMAGEIALVMRMDSWKDSEWTMNKAWQVNGVLFAAFLAFVGLVWFLIRTLW